MDLSFRAIHDIVHPTASFSAWDDVADLVEGDDEGVSVGSGLPVSDNDIDDDDSDSDGTGWTGSQLNPKNRIDSLAPLADPLWRVDGSAGCGTQFYVRPLFLDALPPMHMDVFVQEGAAYPRTLRRLLDLDRAFHTKDAVRVRRLGIAQHILRILQRQTTDPSGQLHPDAVQELYQRGPVGSQLFLGGLGYHVKDAHVVFVPNYALEGELVSYDELKTLWGLTRPGQMPPAVDIHTVRLVRQLHDSVCEVYLTESGDQEGNSSSTRPTRALVVLKSLTSRINYMYQELRLLLRDIPPHPHIIGRPLHIVTKRCLFGSKTGVVGFTMPYHRTGSLRDILPVLRIHGQLRLADQLRWACQLAGAVCHIWHEGHSYYPDLRLDNIVLRGTAPDGDIVVVDFEQRGVWCSFSAPEVDALENMRLVACDDQTVGCTVPPSVTNTYKRKLAECYAAVRASIDPVTKPAGDVAKEPTQETAMPVSSFAAKRQKDPWMATIGALEERTKYNNPPCGYNVAWLCLTRREQEAAMVYMLGRVLWCIFEGVSAPHRGAVWQSYPREPAVEFPAYERTPAVVQTVLTRCFGTEGARERSKFVRQGSKLYMKQEVTDVSEEGRKSYGNDGRCGYVLVSDELGARARGYWQEQLAEGEAWLRERLVRLRQKHVDEDENNSTDISAFGRPTLRKVLRDLEELNAEVGQCA